MLWAVLCAMPLVDCIPNHNVNCQPTVLDVVVSIIEGHCVTSNSLLGILKSVPMDDNINLILIRDYKNHTLLSSNHDAQLQTAWWAGDQRT